MLFSWLSTITVVNLWLFFNEIKQILKVNFYADVIDINRVKFPYIIKLLNLIIFNARDTMPRRHTTRPPYCLKYLSVLSLTTVDNFYTGTTER